MSRQPPAYAILLVLAIAGPVRAQTPTGTITGLATDPSGAALPGVRVEATNRDTGHVRAALSSPDGHYHMPGLQPGLYQLRADAAGFRRVEREVTVDAGGTTTLDIVFELGATVDHVTVHAVQPRLRHDHHQVSGLVTRAQIEALPLNGRDFIELAKLEPGVINPSRLSDGRVFVSSLGGGLQTIPRIGQTRITIDGANVGTPGNVGVILQLSQDVVQEFQLSTVNFDPATSLTSSGAINIVTRSGSNDYRGGGFLFYRNHDLAAYPGLRRDPGNPDPTFRRRQVGGYAGGPLWRDRGFFFASYERHDQRSVVAVQPGTPAFAPLGGIFPIPQTVNLASARVDVRFHRNHSAFGRYTASDNATSAGAPAVLPSGWQRWTNQVGQSLAALTSVLSAQVVNDVRFSSLATTGMIRPASSEECGGCFGLGAPRISIADASLIFGDGGRAGANGRRFQLSELLMWQQRSHSLRVGFEWEHTALTNSNIGPQPALITLWSPERVRAFDPAIALPGSFVTVDDILRLPLRSFETSVGPASPLWHGFRPERVLDLIRLFASDTWRAGPRLTANYGLAWSYEPNALNHDLTKPALLRPILGADGLAAPAVDGRRFSPSAGLVWTATRDGRTVVRVGAGRYYDLLASTHAPNLTNERHLLSPIGTGRLNQSGANIVVNGSRLNFPQPTPFTGAHLLELLPGIRAELERSLNPGNRDFAVRNIDRTKEGTNLYDPSFRTPYAVHVNVGVQRELPAAVVLTADLVWKRFVHTFINGIDYNRWNSVAGPVVPPCSAAQRNDVTAICSNGPLFFDTTIGRARYVGLLARLEKRFSGRGQFLASYALGSFVGSNGTGTATAENPGGRVFGFNNDDWFDNYGPLPTDLRHLLDVSGFVELPWRLRLAINVSASSRPPFAPYVAGVDFNGDGTRDDLLPGTRVNQFGRTLDEDDLRRLVDAYNRQTAHRQTIGGQIAPPIVLAPDFSFGDAFFTGDVRVTRTFTVRPAIRLAVFGEVFNLFNVANLVGYGSNLANSATFGQPTARFTQVFGSGGPRAFQLGARVVF